MSLPQRWAFTCSHCYAPARLRTSDGQHLQMRTLYIECTNLACGAVFRGEATITHQLTVPLTPNPDVRLPLAPAAIRRQARVDSLGVADAAQKPLFTDEELDYEPSAV